MVYVDEAGFDNRDDYPYGYSPKGERCYALHTGKRKERVSWIAALKSGKSIRTVNFCRSRPWIESVASSLTELFGPDAIRDRLAALERHYPWIDPAGFEYFRVRLKQAPRDASYALNLVLERCRTVEMQQRAIEALAFKCDLLWSQLEAIERGDTRTRVNNE